jgi:hypothetical protein
MKKMKIISSLSTRGWGWIRDGIRVLNFMPGRFYAIQEICQGFNENSDVLIAATVYALLAKPSSSHSSGDEGFGGVPVFSGERNGRGSGEIEILLCHLSDGLADAD